MFNVRGVLIASFTDFDDEATEAWDITAEAYVDVFHEEKVINMRKNELLPKNKKMPAPRTTPELSTDFFNWFTPTLEE